MTMIDLVDGYPRQELPRFLKEAIAPMADMFFPTDPLLHKGLVREFYESFFAVQCQDAIRSETPPLLSFSASVAIDLVARLCAKQHRKMYVINPCLDSIRDLLSDSRGLELFAIDEADFHPQALAQKNIPPGSALWLVCPNNPTGFSLSSSEFQALASFARERSLLLICDFCFRLFDQNLTAWDQYKILRESGASFVAIEDTGKVWPLNGIKIALSVSSQDIYQELEKNHRDLYFPMTIPSLHLSVLTTCLQATQKNEVANMFHHVGINRNILKEELAQLPLDLRCVDSQLPLAWINLPENFDAQEMCAYSKERGLALSAGDDFFLSDAQMGSRYIRLSLNRSPEYFGRAMTLFGDIIQELISQKNISPKPKRFVALRNCAIS